MRLFRKFLIARDPVTPEETAILRAFVHTKEAKALRKVITNRMASLTQDVVNVNLKDPNALKERIDENALLLAAMDSFAKDNDPTPDFSDALSEPSADH